MKFIESIGEMREYSQQMKRNGKTIANVSTTGYLHDGHMSLVKIAKDNADVVILSIAHTLEYLYYFETYEKFLQEYKQIVLRFPYKVFQCMLCRGREHQLLGGILLLFLSKVLYTNTVNKIIS